MPFEPDTEETPVLFRASRDGADIVAIFPCEPGTTNGYDMTCYSHIGQHASCTFGWYDTTRPATPEEYADLKAELEGAPYGYRLKVYRRITRTLRERHRAERRRLRRGA